MGVEQLSVLSAWGEECVHAGSRTEVTIPGDGCGDAALKPGPFKNRRVRHPEIQRLLFGWCGRVRHPPVKIEKLETVPIDEGGTAYRVPLAPVGQRGYSWLPSWFIQL